MAVSLVLLLVVDWVEWKVVRMAVLTAEKKAVSLAVSMVVVPAVDWAER